MPEEAANVHATSALPDDVREALAVVNLKTVGEAPAVLQNLALANAVGHQQAMNQISQAATGKIVESIIATSPSEGGIDVAALGQLMKGLSLTPPANPSPSS
ncbi:MAG: RebB family R body protein [Phycisphaerae bacterium]|nr:RebB family R body protein [Phycisphaerae bacterium]